MLHKQQNQHRHWKFAEKIGQKELWGEWENKIYELLEEKLEMDTSNISMEKAHHVGEKSNDKERAIVVQFKFYKDKINIFKNRKKLNKTKVSIFEYFFPRDNANSQRKMKEDKVKLCTSILEVLFVKKAEHQHNRLSDFSQLIFFYCKIKTTSFKLVLTKAALKN